MRVQPWWRHVGNTVPLWHLPLGPRERQLPQQLLRAGLPGRRHQPQVVHEHVVAPAARPRPARGQVAHRLLAVERLRVREPARVLRRTDADG